MMYFNIQRFSTHDGDGIRTILFLKGCSLSCPWCQNPESRSEKPSLLFDPRSCMSGCQLCVDACKKIPNQAIERRNDQIIISRQAIQKAHLIALKHICPTQALTVCGEKADSEVLLNTLLKDQAFYQQSNGGVTFSGGEPLMQAELVAKLARELKAHNVSTAIETCLHVPWKNIKQVANYIDCWLADLKHTDEDKFVHWAKGSLKRIKNNLHKLSLIAKRIVIRVPVVPSFNDTFTELKDIIDFAAALENCHELHLLAYHTLGINKYALLDLPYLCSETPLNNPELLRNIQKYAIEHTRLKIIVRG